MISKFSEFLVILKVESIRSDMNKCKTFEDNFSCSISKSGSDDNESFFVYDIGRKVTIGR